tara:strand:- start:4189 stop:4566 length:378 start_codon:yes stop_codon:yes gene_type:complete
MTYLRKNKLLIFFFIVGIAQILYYWSERSNFKLEILINPFNKNSYVSYFLPKTVIESKQILHFNNIKIFNLSKELKNDMYSFQRIIEFNYPIRFDEKSDFILMNVNENSNCKNISKGKLLKLQKC